MDVRLSVVIPAYNASRYISECLQSVLAQQDAPPFEVIVIDDGSKDDTADIVERDFPTVRLIRKPNGGPGSARNRGVAEARGEVIVFIDADDVMLPGRLAFQGGWMLANPWVGLTFGNQRNQGRPEGDENFEYGLARSEEFEVLPDLHMRMVTREEPYPNTASAMRRDVYLAAGGQPEDINVCEDWAVQCVVSRSWPVAFSRRYVTWYRQGHGGNLMASRGNYKGQVRSRGRELRAVGHSLPTQVYESAHRRWHYWVVRYLFKLWIEDGSASLLAEINAWPDLLPRRTVLIWRAISVLPSGVGDVVRSVRRRVLGVHESQSPSPVGNP